MQTKPCETCQELEAIVTSCYANYMRVPGLNMEVLAKCVIPIHAMQDKPMACAHTQSRPLHFCPECGADLTERIRGWIHQKT